MMIYLDHNATTPLLPEVRAAMEPYWERHYGNPSSVHGWGRRAHQAVEESRELIAASLGANPDEVIFTSGATESNNLAVFGLPRGRGVVVASRIEHPSVFEAVRALTERGFVLHELSVREDGVVELPAYETVCSGETRLVCLMLANNETGAIQPVAELAEICQRSGIPLHCDAAQAVGKIPVHFHQLGVTSLSFSGHKLHGPKGIGGLLVRRGTVLRRLFHGGHQERDRRPGTEPVPLIVGLAKALELAQREMESRRQHVCQLRQLFLEGLRQQCPPVLVNGPEVGGLPHTLNLSFPGCRAEVLVMRFDLAGIACSAGSACSSGSLLPSPVLQAMGLSPYRLHSAVRFSLSHLNTVDEIREAVHRIGAIVRELRELSDEAEATTWPKPLATS